MYIKRCSIRSRIALLLLTLSISDLGWTPKTHTIAVVDDAAITSVCLVTAAAYVGAIVCYGILNNNNSIFNKTYLEELKQNPETKQLPFFATIRENALVDTVESCAQQIASTLISARNACTELQKQAGPSELYRFMPTLDGTHTIPIDALRKWYTTEVVPGGATHRTLDNQFYCNIGSTARSHVTSKPWLDAAREQQNERSAIHHNTTLNTQVKKQIQAFTKNGEAAVYGSKIEQVAALLNNPYFHLSGISYGEELTYAQRQLCARYFHQNGSLCPRALDDRSAAQKIFLKYPGYNNEHMHTFKKSCTSFSIPHCPNRIKKTKHLPDDIANRIHSNSGNKICIEMIAAHATHDMNTVEHIYNQNRDNIIVTELYQQIRNELAAAAKKQDAALKDAHGILHFNLPTAHRDPLIASLSPERLKNITRSSRSLKNFNDLLIVRNHAKSILHKSWEIPFDAEPVVHQAMYGLLDHHTIPKRIDAACALSSDNTKTTDEQNNISHAFFFSNGILKDFVKYDRTRSFRAPSSIHSLAHAHTRQALNHLVYIEHTTDNHDIKLSATHAITQIETALKQADSQESQKLLEDVYAACEVIQRHTPEATCGTTTTPQKLPLPSGPCIRNPHDDITQPTPCGAIIRPEHDNPIQCGTANQPSTVDREQTQCNYSKNQKSSGLMLNSETATPATPTNTITPTSDITIAEPTPNITRTNKKQKLETQPDTLTAEQKEFIAKSAKEYKHKQGLPRCKPHNKTTSKGKHEHIPAELAGVIASEADCEKLAKAYDHTMMTPAGCGDRRSVSIDYYHIFSPVIKVNCNKGETTLAGFHHDYLGIARKSGLIKFQNIKRNTDGTYDALWSYDNAEPKWSTFFPEEWSRSKVIEKIQEVLKHPTSEVFAEERNTIVTGKTSEDIKITIILEGNNKNNNLTGNVITAYPGEM